MTCWYCIIGEPLTLPIEITMTAYDIEKGMLVFDETFNWTYCYDYSTAILNVSVPIEFAPLCLLCSIVCFLQEGESDLW